VVADRSSPALAARPSRARTMRLACLQWPEKALELPQHVQAENVPLKSQRACQRIGLRIIRPAFYERLGKAGISRLDLDREIRARDA